MIGRIASNVGHLIFNPKYLDVATNTLKASKKAQGFSNFHKQVGNCFMKAEGACKNTSFWKELLNSAKSLPKELSSAWKGGTGIWGKCKGVFGKLGKNMPLIGAVLQIAFELPNIYSAFKDKGLWGGLKEVGKSTVKLCGFMGGMVIGGALGGTIGGLVGGMAGDWLVSKLVGKSHSEQKAEAQAEAEGQQQMLALQQQQAAQTQMAQPQAAGMYTQNATTNPVSLGNITMPRATMTPQQLAVMQQMLYGSGMNSLNYMC